MKKKLIMVLVLTIAVLATVFANGGSEASAKKSVKAFAVPEVGYDGSDVTITFYHTMGTAISSVLDDYIVKFNELYPNIHVQWTQVGSYDDVRDQVSTEITVGNQPNIAYCYPDHVALYNLAGAVATLDNFIDSKIQVKRADGTTETLGLTAAQKADYIPGYYEEGRQFGDGLMYTMPWSKSTEVMYYNKTFFEENNLTVPTTWDEVYEVCKKIKAIDPQCIPFGYDSEGNWFITMCEQYGSGYTSATGDHYLFDNATNKDFLTMFSKWYDEGLVTTQGLYGAYTSGLFTATTGTCCYLCIGSSAGANYQCPAKNADGSYPFEVGIARIPQVNAKRPKAISQGPDVVIFNKANPQEVVASWLFVKYMTTNPAFQADFAIASGYLPVIKSVGDNAVYADAMANADKGNAYITSLARKVCLEQADAYYTSPAFNGSSQARDQVTALLKKVLPLNTSDANFASELNKAFAEAIDECEYND